MRNFITTNTTWQRRKWSRKTPTLQNIKNRTHQDPRTNVLMNWSNQPSKPILSKKDHTAYKDVLSSAGTLNNYKQLLAVQPDTDAANALFTVPSNVQCTFHYCMTSLCKIDGEWPSIIFSFSGNKWYILHLVDFAYENHTQIISLLLDTYTQLVLLNDDKQRATAKKLWEETTIIMTDSFEEGLQIENGIVAALGSNHIPLHLLCKVHTFEALNIPNINVLASLEKSLKFREASESINTCVKSFVQGQKPVVFYAIKSIDNFASHDKLSSSTNQRELIDYVRQRENKVKYLSLYQEQCFTKFGYSYASIFDAMLRIQMVLTMLTRHVLLMRRNCNVGRFVWPWGTKLEPQLGTLATTLRCSVMGSE